ncbi:hypothetical protein [Lentzea sp. CC55]|uniref:effector-associated constant component EACC1 n=1 Tax=Lentzea sp. CC55 TaxID=2884909 RepID=UPI0027DF08D7|nr:hypothetical protein [Lentzea sp. CC55]MCG8928343.1 hypothetical protein [Lentzea sp. CC55]
MATISVHVDPHGSDDDARALTRWLREEDDLRGSVSLRAAPIAEGEMGGAIETIVVLITSGTAGAFVSSLFEWINRRRDGRKVSIKIQDAAGRSVELTCGSPEDAQRVLDQLRAITGDGK